MEGISTYGTFDLSRHGPRNPLRRAKARGDYPFAGLSIDGFLRGAKSKTCCLPPGQRKDLPQTIRHVNLVFPENNMGREQEDANRYSPDALILGGNGQGLFDFLREACVCLGHTSDITSRQMKRNLMARPQTGHG